MAIRALLTILAPGVAVADACFSDVPCANGTVCAAHWETDPQEPFAPAVGDCECKPADTKLLPKWSPGDDGWLKCDKAKPTPKPCPAPAQKDASGNCVCPACDSPRQSAASRCKPNECISEGPWADPPCHCYLKPQPQPPAPKDECYSNAPCAGGKVCAAHWQTDPQEPFEPDVSQCQCKPADTKLQPKWNVGDDAWVKCDKSKPALKFLKSIVV